MKGNSKHLLSILLFLHFFLVQDILCAKHIVRTESELCSLLSEDKDHGVILLDGDLFHVADINVKAGGIIKPYPGRKPTIIGFHQKVSRNERPIDQNGYWSIPIKSYGYSQIVFLDEKFEPIPYSSKINGQDGFDIKEKQIKVINEAERLVGVPIPIGFDYLKNRDKLFFKNFSVKMSYWFVGISLRKIYSDANYLYGVIDNAYNYNLLSIRPYAKVQLEFFNLPKKGDGVFLDGNDMLHVPSRYNTVYVCSSPPLLKLKGNNNITFENLSFTGANYDAIHIEGSNKHFNKCTFRNCGAGIITIGNSYSDCSVTNCLFENFYDNRVISFSGINDAVIANNTIRHTGTLMKGGSVISVAGLNFKANDNKVSDYSYIAISVGNTRDYRPGTITGLVSNNIIDNIANYGYADNQLTDGGGIYVITHTDGVVIEKNIVRNIGYEGGELWGIYLDDGAYNCTVRRNLVYNMWPGQYALTARYVDDCERSCMNNIFENNILIGPCKIAGNRKGFGRKTIIRNNYISGELNTQGDEYVSLEGNKLVSAIVREDGRIIFGKGNRIKKRGFTRRIKNLIK